MTTLRPSPTGTAAAATAPFTLRNRVAPGVPAGGQFAQTQRAEPAVELEFTEQFNADGMDRMWAHLDGADPTEHFGDLDDERDASYLTPNTLEDAIELHADLMARVNAALPDRLAGRGDRGSMTAEREADGNWRGTWTSRAGHTREFWLDADTHKVRSITGGSGMNQTAENINYEFSCAARAACRTAYWDKRDTGAQDALEAAWSTRRLIDTMKQAERWAGKPGLEHLSQSYEKHIARDMAELGPLLDELNNPDPNRVRK